MPSYEEEIRQIIREYLTTYQVEDASGEGQTKEQIIVFVRDLIERNEESIIRYKDLLSKVRSTSFVEMVEKSDDLGGQIRTRIVNQIIDKLKESIIYDRSDYISRAIEVFSKPEMVSIALVSMKVKVSILKNAEKVAGFWNELEVAIKAGRSTYPGSGKQLSGPVATLMWALKLYEPAVNGKPIYKVKYSKGSGKYVSDEEVSGDKYQKYITIYENFMGAALNANGDKFPFWALLEYGNTNVILATDKGGYAHPNIQASHSLQMIESEFTTLLNSKLDSLENVNRGDYNYWISETRNTVKKLQELLKILIDFTGDKEPEAPASIEEAFGEDTRLSLELNSRISNKMTEVYTDGVMKEKAKIKARLRYERVVLQIINNRLPENKQIYLGMSGTKQVRVRTVQLKADIKEVYNDLKTEEVNSRKIESILQELKMKIVKLR